MSSQEKQSQRLVRADFGASKGVLYLVVSICLCLLVSSTLALSKRSGETIEFWHLSAKIQAPRVGTHQLWRARYTNFEYGYSITIPRGLVGLSPPAPWPQHGIEITLSRNHHAHILTNADFSAIDYPSLDAAVDSDLKEPENNAQEVQVVNRHREWLGHLEAIRVMVRYKDAVSGATFVEETTTAIRRAKRPEEGVLYTIKLVTPEQRYESNRKVFESILRSWRLRRLSQ